MLAQTHMSTLNTGITTNIALLGQLSSSLKLVSERQYRWQPNQTTSSIGKHTRHIIDHYLCLFSNLGSQFIDYDQRGRDTQLEVSAPSAESSIDTINQQLIGLAAIKDQSVDIYCAQSVNAQPEPIPSNLTRELQFLQSHTLHHMAIIQLMFVILDIKCAVDFSMAPSTKKYRTQHV